MVEKKIEELDVGNTKEDKLKRQKIFHYEFVKKLIDEHISKKK